MRFFSEARLTLVVPILVFAVGVAGFAGASTQKSPAGRVAHHSSHSSARPSSGSSARHPARRAAGHRHATQSASLHHAASRHSRYRGSRRHNASLGQRAMDSQRTMQIQQALIKAHYLNGNPTGQWDQQSQAAMQKYQADNGWQSKITPDSRAIIKLGLGPTQDDGEYPASAAGGISKASAAALTDPLRATATSEPPPTTTQN